MRDARVMSVFLNIFIKLMFRCIWLMCVFRPSVRRSGRVNDDWWLNVHDHRTRNFCNPWPGARCSLRGWAMMRCCICVLPRIWYVIIRTLNVVRLYRFCCGDARGKLTKSRRKERPRNKCLIEWSSNCVFVWFFFLLRLCPLPNECEIWRCELHGICI